MSQFFLVEVWALAVQLIENSSSQKAGYRTAFAWIFLDAVVTKPNEQTSVFYSGWIDGCGQRSRDVSKL